MYEYISSCAHIECGVIYMPPDERDFMNTIRSPLSILIACAERAREEAGHVRATHAAQCSAGVEHNTKDAVQVRQSYICYIERLFPGTPL